MEKRPNWFLLAIAAWLLVLLGLLWTAPAGAQTLPPATGDLQWADEALHKHKWKESEYGLHARKGQIVSSLSLIGTTTGTFDYPTIPVDICETCGLLRIHKEVSLTVGGSTSESLIAGTYRVFNGELLSDVATTHVCVLSVSSASTEIGCLTPENKIHLHPSVKTVCDPARFRRNMRAAVKGSSKAHRYLEACAAKLSK